MLVASGWRAPRPLRALCGGETLPPELARALLEDPHVSLFNLYGPTETTIWSTIERVRAAPGDARLPIGRPVSGTLAYVVDRFGELLPAGAPGELWIGGAGVARGYIGDPELTAARFRSDPFREEVDARVYRTGDRARLRADGRLEHLGRIDWQVKVRGHRVEPGEIEAALAAHPGVVEAVVTAGARDGAVTLVAFYVALGDARPTAAELRAFLAERLPPAFVPGLLFRLAALPRGATGKVDRAALPELPEAGEARPNEPPRGPIEGALARIWKQALGIGAVDRRDRFLDLGGHSLLALAVVAQIEQELGVRVRPLDLLFSDLAQLAAACAPDEDRSWVTRLLRRAKG
jgi:acyl-coenzyme A synthetase/AMP-(fatty) acid ligase